MSRYLTPSRIGLLVLVSLYTESAVPFNATIPVLSFVCSHILAKFSQTESVPVSHEETASTVDDFQNATIGHASGIPGRTIWDLVLSKLWKIDSLDGLHQFFDDLSFLVSKSADEMQNHANEQPDPVSNRILLSRTSPLGAFVRRAKIEFTRLQFHDGVALWSSFVAFRAPTLPQWRKRNPSASLTSFDTNLNENHPASSQKLMGLAYREDGDGASAKHSVSTADIERLLEFQVDRMQRRGTRLPPKTRDTVRRILNLGVTIPSFSYYVDFLDSWRAGDYPSAFDSLHRYFDYTMHNRDRAFYQYALLNLALLHADFGCPSEALTAMEEAIATARENNDMACLNYSLSWLYHFGKAHPAWMGEIRRKGLLGPEREALTFLKSKAKETQMWSLLSTSFLSEAKVTLAQGESISQAFENVLKSSHINLVKHVPSVVGNQMMMQMALFSRLGVNLQASLTGDLFQLCYSSESPLEDTIHSTCNSAHLLAQKGQYKDAIAELEAIDPENVRHIGHRSYWTLQLGLLKFYRHLFRNRPDAANEILRQLKSSADVGSDAKFHVDFAQIDLQLREREYAVAMSNLEEVAARMEEEDADVWWRIKAMVVKARIFEGARIPQKGFSISLRAASLAWSSKILPLLWEAVTAMCVVFNSVNEFEASTKLLESIVPQVLECEDCELAARTFSILADSHVGAAGQAKPDSLQRKEHLSRGVENIDRAFDQLSRLEDVRGQCEMMAKKATIMHVNGDQALANDYAAKYLAIKKAAEEEQY